MPSNELPIDILVILLEIEGVKILTYQSITNDGDQMRAVFVIFQRATDVLKHKAAVDTGGWGEIVEEILGLGLVVEKVASDSGGNEADPLQTLVNLEFEMD